jgi:uncharacterized protein YbjT (DUF2867 family)
MKKAIVFGASGFIGSFLLEELLNDAAYEQVIIVVRKELGIRHPKLVSLIGDYHSLPSLKEKLAANEIFIALGTTKKNTPDENKYYETDHDYPVLAAKIAKENGAESVLLVSAVGPNPNSKVFYIRTKAETERDIAALGFAHTHIFRPSMLMGNRKEKRPLEKFLIKVFAVINPLFIGPLNKFRGIEGKSLAKAMVIAARDNTVGYKVYEWKEINDAITSSHENH